MRKEIGKKWQSLSNGEKKEFLEKSKKCPLEYIKQKGRNSKNASKVRNSKFMFLNYDNIFFQFKIYMLMYIYDFQSYLHTRCSPDRVYKLLQHLQPNQKAAIQEIGFGGILGLRCTKLDHSLCHWLVENFDTLSCTLSVHNTSIKLSPMDVELILGLKAKGVEVDIERCTSKWNDLYNMYCDGKGKLSLLMLENQIRQEKECGDEFKIRFVLFVLGALLCPTMKVSVKPSFLHLLEDTASIKKINWAQIVFFFLVRGINEFKSKKRSSGISGCLFFLMVIHF